MVTPSAERVFLVLGIQTVLSDLMLTVLPVSLSQPASSSPEAPVREKSPPLPPAQREEEPGQGAERFLH